MRAHRDDKCSGLHRVQLKTAVDSIAEVRAMIQEIELRCSRAVDEGGGEPASMLVGIDVPTRSKRVVYRQVWTLSRQTAIRWKEWDDGGHNRGKVGVAGGSTRGPALAREREEAKRASRERLAELRGEEEARREMAAAQEVEAEVRFRQEFDRRVAVKLAARQRRLRSGKGKGSHDTHDTHDAQDTQDTHSA